MRFQFFLAILPLFLSAFVTSRGQLLIQTVVYLAFSLVFYAAPLLLTGSVRALLWMYFVLGTGAWVFLIFICHLGRVPVGSLPDIVATSNLREMAEYITANRLWPWLTAGAIAASFSIVGILRTPLAKIPPTWRKSALALVLSATAITLNWDFLPVVGKLFPSPASDVAAWEAYPPGLFCLAKTLTARWTEKPGESAPPFNVVRESVPTEPELHVLVIGESSRWDKWALNGYARATSPNLSAMSSDELASFSKAHAGANLTYLAVPLILSGIPAENYYPGETVRNLMGLMKEAGFTTAWLSSQDTSVAPHASSPADFEVKRVNTLNEVAYYAYERLPFDGELLPVLENFVGYDAKRKFVVLHVSGSHMEYAARYPAEFGKFSTAKDGLYADLQPDKAKKRDEYDNSILYSDWFLGHVIDLVRHQSRIATVTFVSDHGEALYDGPGGRLGHGSVDASEQEQHIPLFVWASPAFRAHYKEKWQALQGNRDKPVGEENILHTIADLLDLDYQGQDRTMSFARNGYAMRAGARVISSGYVIKPGMKSISNETWLVPVRVM